MTTVAVVDDHPLFRDGLVGLLATIDGVVVVGAGGDGAEARRLATTHRPEIVFMDLNLPDHSGIEATRQVLIASPDSRVIVMTMVDDDDAVAAALSAGAQAYLLKGAGREEVIGALHTVMAGGTVLGAGLAARLLAAPTAAVQSATAGLTERERQVLASIATGQTNKQIAKELGLSVKTVQNHVSRVLMKMQAADRTQAALRARNSPG